MIVLKRKTCAANDVDDDDDGLIRPSFRHPQYYTCPSISKNCLRYHGLVVQLCDNTWLPCKGPF